MAEHLSLSSLRRKEERAGERRRVLLSFPSLHSFFVVRESACLDTHAANPGASQGFPCMEE
jgi:hypothetical protein